MRRILLVMAVLMVTSLGLQAQVKFTISTYNVKSFEGNDKITHGHAFEMSYFINDLKPLDLDLLAINELEINTGRTDYRDLIAVLGRGLGMYSTFGKSYDKAEGYYGNGLLSRYPILNTYSREIVKPIGSSDQRSMLCADILHPSGQIFRVVVTHLDHRSGQIDQLRDILHDAHIAKSPYPIILMGDFNMWYDGFRQEMKGFAVMTDPQAYTYEHFSTIDYMFAYPSTNFKLLSTGVEYGIQHSDHFPVVSKIEWRK